MTEKSECYENAFNKVRVFLKLHYFTPPPDHLFLILHTSQLHCPQEKIKANGEPNVMVANLIFFWYGLKTPISFAWNSIFFSQKFISGVDKVKTKGYKVSTINLPLHL